MPSTAAAIVLVAGGVTFANEWYQAHTINWRVPIATVLAAAVFDGLAHLDDKAAVGVSIMVLIGALLNKSNGHSVVDSINSAFTQVNKPEKTPQPASKAA